MSTKRIEKSCQGSCGGSLATKNGSENCINSQVVFIGARLFNISSLSSSASRRRRRPRVDVLLGDDAARHVPTP